jgi:hypothetical protein
MCDWKELDEDERFTADRLPHSAEFSAVQRRRHRFCTSCWFEDNGREKRDA